MLAIKVRKLIEKDVPKIHSLDVAVWGTNKNRHSMKERRAKITIMRRIGFGAFFKGKLISYALFDPHFKLDAARLDSISTLKEYQCTGIGLLLLKKFEKECKRMKKTRIFVFSERRNRKMPLFLRRTGFKKAGSCKWLYRGGTTALIYCKPLT